jgi:signal transduction histidine kinase
VADTGSGIRPEDLPHVFSRYWQAKRTAHLGSGLGLAIAKGIAEAHHGRVDVQSEVGRGSTFSLYIPRSPDCNDPNADR